MAETKLLGKTATAQIELETVGKIATFRLVGVVDENLDLSVVQTTLEQMGTSDFEYHFDLGQIKRINSPGVRAWIQLMWRVPPQARYAFVNVCELMVEQANMIPDILGRAGTPVLSFQAPYNCVKCDKSIAITLDPKQVTYLDGNPGAPPVNCPTCATPMIFDWPEDEYFGFLKRT